METLQVFGLGAVGAILPDLLKFINGRFEEAPNWIKRWHYWVAAILLVLLGGFVSYFTQPTRVIDALALGYSAPAVVASLLGRRDGGAVNVDATPKIGGTLENLARPKLYPKLIVPVPQFVRGLRVAWALR